MLFPISTVQACLPKSEWRVQFGRRMASSAAGQRAILRVSVLILLLRQIAKNA